MPNETNETLSPEQFFEQHHFAGEYIRKEDFLKYCEGLIHSLWNDKNMIDSYYAGKEAKENQKTATEWMREYEQSKP